MINLEKKYPLVFSFSPFINVKSTTPPKNFNIYLRTLDKSSIEKEKLFFTPGITHFQHKTIFFPSLHFMSTSKLTVTTISFSSILKIYFPPVKHEIDKNRVTSIACSPNCVVFSQHLRVIR